MKKSELRQIIKEEIKNICLTETNVSEDEINDIVDKLNDLPYTGSAIQKGTQVFYYLDDKNVDKEARTVKKLMNTLGWKLAKDNDDILIFKKR